VPGIDVAPDFASLAAAAEHSHDFVVGFVSPLSSEWPDQLASMHRVARLAIIVSPARLEDRAPMGPEALAAFLRSFGDRQLLVDDDPRSRDLLDAFVTAGVDERGEGVDRLLELVRESLRNWSAEPDQRSSGSEVCVVSLKTATEAVGGSASASSRDLVFELAEATSIIDSLRGRRAPTSTGESSGGGDGAIELAEARISDLSTKLAQSLSRTAALEWEHQRLRERIDRITDSRVWLVLVAGYRLRYRTALELKRASRRLAALRRRDRAAP